MKSPFIKWTGSKRTIADKIISYFPKEINTYYEPFLGGGSVFFELLKSDIKVEKYILSDINKNLIELFQLLQNNHESLIDEYTKNWNNLQNDKNYYYIARNLFNENKNSHLFYFLTRTCYNGTIRYNNKGEFNTSLHFSRDGINPETLKQIIYYYHNLLKNKNIEFIQSSFENINPLNNNDVIYLDPPYTTTKALYFGNINLENFLKWIENIKCNWFMNINGINNTNNEENILIPYTEKVLLSSGNSSFSRLKNKSVNVQEYFYYSII